MTVASLIVDVHVELSTRADLAGGQSANDSGEVSPGTDLGLGAEGAASREGSNTRRLGLLERARIYGCAGISVRLECGTSLEGDVGHSWWGIEPYERLSPQ